MVDPVVVGTGSHTVVCLPGWFGHSNGWGSLPDVLDTDTYRWVFADYRGYGTRLSESAAYTPATMAEDALAAADAVGAERFSVVGHSMGGVAAQQVLATAPERVASITGISPIAASGFEMDHDTRALFDGAAHDDAKRFTILDITTGSRCSRTWLERMVESSVAHSTREAFAGYLLAWTDADFAASLADVSVPAMAVIGEHDPAVDADYINQSWQKTFVSGRVETLANAGHYPMFETPIALATALEDFLSEVDAD